MDAKPTMTAAEEAAWERALTEDALFETRIEDPNSLYRPKRTFARPYARARAFVVIEPQRTLCRLCGLVYVVKGDICPPSLRSMKEQAQIDAEIMARRAS